MDFHCYISDLEKIEVTTICVHPLTANETLKKGTHTYNLVYSTDVVNLSEPFKVRTL